MKYQFIIILILLITLISTKNNTSISRILGFRPFPDDSTWNKEIINLPVHINSSKYIKSIGENDELHPDFGTVWEGAPIGFPYYVVGKNQPKVKIIFETWDNRDAQAYPDESDSGPYPIPDYAQVEGGELSNQDRHVIVIDKDNKILYELYHAKKFDNHWKAISGAVFDLKTNDVRPKYWTTADAAGLPIFTGLVRYEEILTGEIKHAIRVTVPKTQKGFIFPARHFASDSSNTNLPPMGLKLRLKQNYDISVFSKTNQIILIALKKYGIIIADNGAPWYISGSPDSRWNDTDLHNLSKIKGNDLEAVYSGEIEN